jgi:hypothetical protein
MKRALFVLLSLGFAGLLGFFACSFVACSGDDPIKIPDTGPETSVKDTGVDCGPIVNPHCREGAPYKACGKEDQPVKAVDGSAPCLVYGCAPGQIPVSLCGCQAETYKIDAGDNCPGIDGGPD